MVKLIVNNIKCLTVKCGYDACINKFIFKIILNEHNIDDIHKNIFSHIFTNFNCIPQNVKLIDYNHQRHSFFYLNADTKIFLAKSKSEKNEKTYTVKQLPLNTVIHVTMNIEILDLCIFAENSYGYYNFLATPSDNTEYIMEDSTILKKENIFIDDHDDSIIPILEFKTKYYNKDIIHKIKMFRNTELDPLTQILHF